MARRHIRPFAPQLARAFLPGLFNARFALLHRLCRVLALSCIAGTVPLVQAQSSIPGIASSTAPSSDGDRSSGGVISGMGDAKTNAPATAASVTAQPTAAPRPSLGLPDRRRLRALVQTHLAAIKLAGLATANSTDPATRGYAQKMLEVHGAALDELRLLARRSGVVVPGGLEAEQATLLHDLAGKTGAAFDQMYLQQAGRVGHEQSLRLLDDTIAGSYAPELKALAGRESVVARQQLQLAQQMQAEPAKAAALVAASVLAGQSGSATGTAGTALSQPGNRYGSNSGEKGAASLAGAAVHPRQ